MTQTIEVTRDPISATPQWLVMGQRFTSEIEACAYRDALIKHFESKEN